MRLLYTVVACLVHFFVATVHANADERLNLTNTFDRRSLSDRRISFKKFNRYNEIMDYMDYLGKKYSQIAKVEVRGKSSQGRDMKTISISKGGQGKPIILIDAGIHAREWAAPAAALYLMQQLVEHSDDHADMLERTDWIILPLVNPDGYEYTFTHDRLWRKTRSNNKRSMCKGADANRNFNFHWMGEGVSDYPCSETYGGSSPESEPETRVLRDIFHSSSLIKLYISFHAYGSYILHPWGFDESVPENVNDLSAAGQAAADAIQAVSGTKYIVGGSGVTLYPAAGGSDDYALAVAGIELSYTWELPGGDFIIPEREIIGIVQETLEGLRAFAKFVGDKYG